MGWNELAVMDTRNVTTIAFGKDQSGKTDWAFTAPDPILTLTFDPGNMKAPRRRHPEKRIMVAAFDLPKGLVPSQQLMELAETERDRYRATFEKAVADPEIRTIIMDREDEAWELWRHAEFLDGAAKAHHYTPVNSDFKAMIKQAEKAGKNLIMIDAVKDEWKDNKPTGRTIKEGFKHLGMLSGLTLEMVRGVYDDFSITIRDCRDNATRNGHVITPAYLGEQLALTVDTDDKGGWAYYAEMDFANLMTYLIEGSTQEDWR